MSFATTGALVSAIDPEIGFTKKMKNEDLGDVLEAFEADIAAVEKVAADAQEDATQALEDAATAQGVAEAAEVAGVAASAIAVHAALTTDVHGLT